jgi:hypothetical protein
MEELSLRGKETEKSLFICNKGKEIRKDRYLQIFPGPSPSD